MLAYRMVLNEVEKFVVNAIAPTLEPTDKNGPSSLLPISCPMCTESPSLWNPTIRARWTSFSRVIEINLA